MDLEEFLDGVDIFFFNYWESTLLMSCVYKSAVIYHKSIIQTREGTDYNKKRIVT